MLTGLFTEFEADALAPLKQDIIRGEHVRAALAINNQRKLEEAQAQIEHRSVEGLGQLECRVSADVYFRLSHLHGLDAWKDPGFLKSLRQKNPGMFSPRRREQRVTLRVDGLKAEGGTRNAELNDARSARSGDGTTTLNSNGGLR